jgi:kynurenine formamidase
MITAGAPFSLIDLSHSLDSNIPSWDSDCGFHQAMVLDYCDADEQAQFRVMRLQLNAGAGTHIDAPSHCIPGGKGVDDLNLNDLIMPCVVIDITDRADEAYCLGCDDITNFEQLHGIIGDGTAVIVKTGWAKFWHNPEKYRNNLRFPAVSIEAAQLLLQRGVAALGIDTLSSDRPDSGFPVHQAFLGAGKILIENVANLDAMNPTGDFLMALPLKIKHGTESPVRLVGLRMNGGITTQDPIVDGIVQGLHEIRQGQSVKMTAMDIFNEE